MYQEDYQFIVYMCLAFACVFIGAALGEVTGLTAAFLPCMAAAIACLYRGIWLGASGIKGW